MFSGCSGLTTLDLSNFNTEKVESIYIMFYNCSNLVTIIVDDGWTTEAVLPNQHSPYEIFQGCSKLVGGMGTAYSLSSHDLEYARIDGGPENPGYLTRKVYISPGDVDGDGVLTISDATTLIDYLLHKDATGLNLDNADVNQDGSVDIADVTSLIDILLSHNSD